MGQCNKCGLCCKALMLSYSKDYCKEHIVDCKESGSIYKHYKFVIDSLEELTPEQAFEINPYLHTEAIRRGWMDSLDRCHFYRCKLLGGDNTCTVHDNKPEMCSGYPWYGRLGGSKDALFSAECGYMDETDEVKGAETSVNYKDDSQERVKEWQETIISETAEVATSEQVGV